MYILTDEYEIINLSHCRNIYVTEDAEIQVIYADGSDDTIATFDTVREAAHALGGLFAHLTTDKPTWMTPMAESSVRASEEKEKN